MLVLDDLASWIKNEACTGTVISERPTKLAPPGGGRPRGSRRSSRDAAVAGEEDGELGFGDFGGFCGNGRGQYYFGS
jgi:hypothetical protein